MKRQRTLLLITIALTIGLCGFVGYTNWQQVQPENQRGYVSREQLGDDWPLAVPSGILECQPGQVVIFRSGGVVYAVNGTAKGLAEANRWQEIEDIGIRLADQGPGAIKNLQPILDRGLALCS